jgi:hypothetical protein
MKKLLVNIIFIFLVNHSYSQYDTAVMKEELCKPCLADMIYEGCKKYIVDRIKENLLRSFSYNYLKKNYHTYDGCYPDIILGAGKYYDYYWDCYADSLFQKYFVIESNLIRYILDDSNTVNIKEYTGQDYKAMSVPFYFKLSEFNYCQSNSLIHYTDSNKWESNEIIIPEYILRNDSCNFLRKSDLLKIVGIYGYNIDVIPEDYKQNGIDRKLIDDAYLKYDTNLKQWVWKFYIENNEKNGLYEMMVPAIIIFGDFENTLRRQIFKD